MRIVRVFITGWWLVYSAALVLTVVYVLMGIWGEPSADSDSIIYVQVMFRHQRAVIVLLAAIGLGSGAFLYWKNRHNSGRSFVMFAAPLLFIILPLSLAEPAIGDTRLFHLDSARYGDKLYNLAQYESGFRLGLYECHMLGISCHTIYRGSSIQNFNCIDQCPTHLSTENSRLSLIVRGETVFTYTPAFE
jgi:hypothetical protein